MAKSYFLLPKELQFTPEELVLLYDKNLGLRLTNNLNECADGGFGDLVPLSHLAGALDSITYLRLALKNPKNHQDIEKLNLIYGRYEASSPDIMLSYAQKCDFQDCIKPRINTCLPPKEEAALLDMHEEIPSPDFINKLPVFSQHLADHFNKQLAQRLDLNWNFFTNARVSHLAHAA